MKGGQEILPCLAPGGASYIKLSPILGGRGEERGEGVSEGEGAREGGIRRKGSREGRNSYRV